MPVSQRYWCEFAWIDGQVRADVWLTVDGGRFTEVTLDAAPDGIRLYGLTLPGLANAHSHAFHRALRGRVEPGHESGSFWTWRDAMYGVADSLDPDTYFALARAVYAEMALAGVTCVGEFHYLHHGPGGTPYDDPNAMGAALMSAAAEAGIRITLLDTCYLTSTVDGQPLRGPQRRFGDGSAAGWAERVSAVRPAGPGALIGAAVHSVRAVPDAELPVVMEWAAGKPVHVHVSEQPAENKASLVHYGRTPTAVLADAGVLGPTTTAVHATHLTDADRAALGDSGTAVCLCPTTERDLADGLGPAAALADAGSPLCLGSDSHAVIDLFEEARGMELHERLRTGHRGLFPAAALVRAATIGGHAALGWSDAGTIAPGARADLVTVALDSVRTTGCRPPEAVFAATAADVRHVLVDGRPVVRDGVHQLVPDVARALGDAIAAVLP
ncbi:formimidoylglutamate deiminase [Virgisporangium aurantiacum]|uniref:formimidoylglutamate deiminase n=1 Tax=Virgisporangium aurantiacum TaxID=175570 RepID=UPI001951DDEB|nr:formimidoylglutamate deiminase [Virgisporangium aurantiacum]